MIILGIDPGLANTGWGVIEQSGPRSRCVAYGCVTTRASEPLAQRLSAIHEGIVAVIERYTPQECAVESVFFGSNAKSAFATGQARGVALLATAASRIELAEYSPLQIKSVVTGSGAADKRQMQYMVRALLNLDHEPKPDHSADALAAAICHGTMRGHAALEREGRSPARETA